MGFLGRSPGLGSHRGDQMDKRRFITFNAAFLVFIFNWTVLTYTSFLGLVYCACENIRHLLKCLLYGKKCARDADDVKVSIC